MNSYCTNFLTKFLSKNFTENLYIQAVYETLTPIRNLIDNSFVIQKNSILDRLCEPERQLVFKVTWRDKLNNIRTNTGFRVGFNSNLGPYKGGLRFHPNVTLNAMKFLSFEQTFKNSLTGLSIGGGKGGSDFNPKDKSDLEIMDFCKNFSIELSKYVSDSTDVPAGDIGVDSKIIDYIYGYYKKINSFKPGTFTGKSVFNSGSFLRKESTGFGCAYFAQEVLNMHEISLKGKTTIVSGSGNVAIYLIKKLTELGSKVIACSDSTGVIVDYEGIDWFTLKKIKEDCKCSLEMYASLKKKSTYYVGKSIWNVPCEIAFPCATQNEITLKDARLLVKNGCYAVIEGANMPCTLDAALFFKKNNIIYVPSKAANSGGVVVSYFEMQQNSQLETWTTKKVDNLLRDKMKEIHKNCLYYSTRFIKKNNYVFGANLYSFLRLVDSYIRLGLI